MRFLSKKSQFGTKTPPTRHSGRNVDGHKRQRQQNLKPDYSARFAKQPSFTPTSMAEGDIFSEIGGPYSQRMPSPVAYHSPSKPQSQHGAKYVPHDNFPRNVQGHNTGNREDQNKPGSASFYTWSESNRCNSNDLFELCLGKVLPVDFAQRTNGPFDASNSDKSYWDIEGLKSLLRSRKRPRDSGSMSSDASEKHTKRRCLPPEPKSRSRLDQSREHQEGPAKATPTKYQRKADPKAATPGRQNLSSSRVNSRGAFRSDHSAYHSLSAGMRQTENRPMDADVFHRSHSSKPRPSHDSPGHKNQSGTGSMLDSEIRWIDTLGPTRPNKEVPVFEEGDELFMRTLDAAYNSILNPEDHGGAFQHQMDDIPVHEDASMVHRRNGNGGSSTAERLNALVEKADGSQPTLSDPYGLINEEQRWPRFVQHPTSELLQRNHGLGPSVARLSSLAMCQGVNELREERGPPSRIDMAGFWRQNKLY